MKPKKEIKSKNPDIGKELFETKKQAETYLENWRRCQADYANLKRRMEEKEKEMICQANTDLILKIVPVLDNFKRAFKHIPKENLESDWVSGIKHLEKQLEDILEKEGLEKIKTEGEKFNPEFHEALLTDNKKDMASDIILEELEAGYMLGDKVIKPAKVKVNKT